MKKTNGILNAQTLLGKTAHVGMKALMLSMMAAGLVSPAVADELGDLKALVKQLAQRIEQLEAKSAPTPPSAPAPAPAAPAPVANAVAVNPGFQVRLYGRGDLGITSSNGSKSDGSSFTTNRIQQGEMAARLGLTGSYPIDADTKAIFSLESGLSVANGNAGGGVQNISTGGLLFNRGSVVGLSNNNYGSMEAGLMYMAPFWVMLAADNVSANNYGLSDFSALFSLSRPEAMGKYLKGPSGASNANSHTGTAGFYANSLRYRTPAMGAFSGEFSYSMGQQTLGTNALKDDGTTWALNVQYKDGPLYLGYGHMNYQQVNDVAPTVTVAPGVSRDQTTDILGAKYIAGPLTVGGSYTSFAVSNAGGYAAKTFGLSGAYDMGKHRIELSAARITYDGASAAGAYGLNSAKAGGEPSSDSVGLGYLYNVSKTLSYYTYYQTVNNNSNANLGANGFRGDNSAFGFSPNVWTAGMFLTF